MNSCPRFLSYLLNRLTQVQDELYLLDMGSKKRTRLGSERCARINAYSNKDEPWLFATFNGFTRPRALYMYDFTSKSKDKCWGVYRSVEASGVKHEDFKVDQIWYKARDGTDIPMFTLRHKDTPEKGVPILQYGENLRTLSVAVLELNTCNRLWRIQCFKRTEFRSHPVDIPQTLSDPLRNAEHTRWG